MNESPVTFHCSDLSLEGLIALPAQAAAGAAVVCHPHPMYGGSMYNNVVEAALDALWRCSYATLRFNFRGVGTSEGEYEGGEGEVEDARAAASFLRERSGLAKVTLAGYSFGAAMAVPAGLADPAVDRVIAIALPVGAMKVSLDHPVDKPLLLFSGDRDSYSPVETLRQMVGKIGPRARLEVIAGADHFFGGCESRLSDAIAAALTL
jgi:alpha/beta superfamily hydrolase